MSEKFDHKFKTVTWLPVSKLSIVWADAQRPLKESHVKWLQAELDPEKFGTLTVTKADRNGSYHVIDGHHRKVAVERLWGPNETVPCQVLDVEDAAHAAALFDSINSGRAPVHPIDLFRTRVTAEKPTQVAVDRIVRDSGYSVGYRSARSLACVGVLETIYESGGSQVLAATLTSIRGAWGDEAGPTITASVVRGIGLVVAEYGNLNLADLVKVLRDKYSPSRLANLAKGARDINARSLSINVRDLIVKAYNSNSRSRKRHLIPNDKGKKAA